ncbi:phenylalanine--tRNA ligase subunit beta [Chloroflexota bacterium]
MKVSLKWLQEYIDVNLSPAELVNRLAMAGIEAKGVQVIGGNWESIVVGRITAIDPHPNADRLRLPTIDTGTGQHTVVCGAPNLNIGDKVAFAYVGAELIDGHTGKKARLKAANIRGVASSGMACSEMELGISDSHEGILILPEDAPLGMPLADLLGNVIFDFEVTPNRPDCLSVIGLGREVAALTGQNIRLPEADYPESDQPVDSRISVEIASPDLCPRYCASLITGITIAESPKWLQQRLLECGMRPINNIVDITNYVMLEYGQPLHSFDYQQLKSRKIVVRPARQGEVMVTLDGEERILTGNMLTITDGQHPVAVAGVMGGAESEVTPVTKDILLESASFNPASIHYTGRTLNLPSEACMRFERGISPNITVPALKRATQLIVQLAGGQAARGLIDVYPGKKERGTISVTAAETKRLLGIEFSLDQIAETLSLLGFECQKTAAEVHTASPWWRSDIHRTVDIVEEVARIIGYDNIPMTMLSQPIPRQNPDPVFSLKNRLNQGLVGYGFQEIINFSLTGMELLERLLPESRTPQLMPLRVANPMTAEQEYLRPHLRVNLLTALSENRKHTDAGIRLFELGKVYLPREKDLPREPEVLCGVLSGTGEEKTWHGGGSRYDFYDAKGIIEGLLNQMGIAANFEDSDDESLHPVKQAAITTDGNRLGVVGELHPRALQSFDIAEPAYLFEIELTALIPLVTGNRTYQPVLRFPGTTRDIALIVDSEVTHQAIQDIISSFALVNRVALFDVYAGDQVPPGKKSLAYSITFQSQSQTLTDEAVNQVQQQILKKLSQALGATLRN